MELFMFVFRILLMLLPPFLIWMVWHLLNVIVGGIQDKLAEREHEKGRQAKHMNYMRYLERKRQEEMNNE